MKEAWGERFRDSLARWLRAAKDPALRSLELEADTGEWLRRRTFVESAEVDELFRTSFEFLIRQISRGLSDGLTEAACRCQSLIEDAMLVALLLAAGESCEQVFLRMDNRHYGYLTQGLDSLTIEPQAQLGEVRVDFLLRYRSYGPWFPGEVAVPGGKRIPGVQKNLIVECDGHAFHERTKAQASKDRGRDRFLQKLGYPVYRYTGSDIWHDVFRCAGEAIGFLLDRAGREKSRDSGLPSNQPAGADG